MKAQQLMTQPVITCHVNDAMNVAAQLMWDHDCGALPVVNDDGKLVGMLTDRDICMAACAQGRPLDELLVHSGMSRHVVSVREQVRIGELERLMAEHRVRRIPVIDSEGRPIGIVSIDDLAIASSHPDTRIPYGMFEVTQTLASICYPRRSGAV